MTARKPGKDSFGSAIHSLILWILMLLVTLITGIILLPFMIIHKPHIIQKVGVRWARTLLWLGGIRVIVHNPEQLVTKGPVIVLSNHQSLLDVLIMYHVIKVQFAWMAKASLFKIPLFGWAMWAAGYIPVERENRQHSRTSLYKAADRIRAGRSVIIFPEGTRGHPDGSMRHFKKGGFILAKKAMVQLQPLSVWGAQDVIPPKQQNFMQRVFPGTVEVIVHKPIPATEYAQKSQEELSEYIRTIIEAPLPELKQHALERRNSPRR
ncbi:MAG: 1-acyl-sn-glycerol-3-phosphate acyltransferase [Leptospiraceae bacterium]|nr:1-acyl-sn-glycerol-3-phosphate acyltransferase [Leptospiraceae bacterium]